MASTSKNKETRNWFLRNLIWAIIFIFALVVVLQILLNIFTHHGKVTTTPDFTGMTVKEAKACARRNGVRVEVIDSVYEAHLPLGSVFSQNPHIDARVKKGRRIHLVINSTQPKTVPMPNLVGLTLRGAKAAIASNGLTIGNLSYVPDMATNYVLAQKVKGRTIKPGKLINKETAVDLTLGVNSRESVTYVPHLSGMTLQMARDFLTDNALNVGKVRFDSTVKTYSDSLQAQVYKQTPAYSRTTYHFGTKVDIYLTLNRSKVTKALPSVKDEPEREQASADSTSEVKDIDEEEVVEDLRIVDTTRVDFGNTTNATDD